MKLRNIQLHTLISLLLSLLLLLAVLPSGWAEGDPIQDPQAGIGEETTAPEGSAAAESVPGQSDWETRLLLMLQEHDANPDTIAAGYYNLATGEEHYYNGDQYRVSGSMYKVPLNMLFLDWIAEGKITLDEPIGGYRYSQLLEGTIIDSNNEYAKLLWDYAGATISTNPASTLYHRYRILIAPIMGEDPDNVDDKYYENNFFTPRQMITCLRQLYDGGERYDRLIETMQRAEPEKYFKLRERRFNIAHKYGWYAEDPILYLNDCALCFTEDPIAIVLFTTGTENAYGVLTDFCTVMCDYAEEKHAERLERAREEEQAAALAAEQDRLAAEAAAVTQESTRRTEPVKTTQENPSAAKTEETWIHELTLGPILSLGLIAAGVLASLIWFSIRHRGSRLNLWYGIAAVLLAAGAMIVCFPGMSGRSFVSASNEDAPVTVDRFFRALESGDAAAADACLAYGAQSGLLNGYVDEVHAAARDALQRSWNHQLLGNCSVEKTRAWQEVQLRVLDFSKMQKDLQTETRVQLLELARTMNRENVYDAAGNYVPEAAGLAYDRAMMKLLEQPQNYYGTVGCPVELTLTGDGWKIVPTRTLISALSGTLG